MQFFEILKFCLNFVLATLYPYLAQCLLWLMSWPATCYCNNQNWWWVQTRHSLIFDTFLWPDQPPAFQATLHLPWAATAVMNFEWIFHTLFYLLLLFFNQIAPFIIFINPSHKNFPRMFNISLILLFVATGYLLGQRYSSSFSVNPNIVWLRTVFVSWKISLILATWRLFTAWVTSILIGTFIGGIDPPFLQLLFTINC